MRPGIVHHLFSVEACLPTHEETATVSVAQSQTPTADLPDLTAAPLSAPAGLSRQDVVLAFELLLGRPPENESTIAKHQTLASRTKLGDTIRNSAEFQARNAESQRKPRATSHVALNADAPLLAEYSFRAGGTGTSLLRDGWSKPEAEFCWSVGLESHIDLPVPTEEREVDLAITLRLVPFKNSQRISVDVEGVELVSTLAERRLQLACRVPARLLAGRHHVRVTLHQPDASRPSGHGSSGDERALGLGLVGLRLTRLPVEPAGLDDRSVLRNFESLGDNCEFGFVMQHRHVFGGGLLRFNIMPTDQLLRGLASQFDGFPDRSLMRLERHNTRAGGHEYVVYEDGYGFAGHTTITLPLDELGQARLLDQEHTRLSFLKRVLLEELENGETIFVFKRNAAPSEAEVMALWLGIRGLGRCSLLWVVPEAPGRPGGTVNLLAEGLYKGYIDQFAPYANAEDFSASCWMTICRRALHLSRLDLADST